MPNVERRMLTEGSTRVGTKTCVKIEMKHGVNLKDCAVLQGRNPPNNAAACHTLVTMQ